MTTPQQVWSVPLRVDTIPEGGRDVQLHAGADIRAALARPARVQEVLRLDAGFHVLRRGRDGVRVTGTVSARVRQACVITLEPVENDIAEAIDLVFAPQADAEHGVPAALIHEGSSEAGEAPEPLVGGVIDLAAIAIEFFVLGVDPYPRKAGAVLDTTGEPDAASAHPFAALASLRRGGDSDA